MTGGGLMQLVAYGAQDVYLTGNPQITFFKVVYRRHTNFAMESIENPFNGAPNFGKKVTCTVQRNGDLIYRMYLQATLPQVQLQSTDGSGAQFRWLNWIGHNIINYVEIEIGGQRIDKQYGQWLHIWNELTQEPGKQAGYAKMVGNVPELTNLLYQGGSTCDNDCYGGEPPRPKLLPAARRCTRCTSLSSSGSAATLALRYPSLRSSTTKCASTSSSTRSTTCAGTTATRATPMPCATVWDNAALPRRLCTLTTSTLTRMSAASSPRYLTNTSLTCYSSRAVNRSRLRPTS